MKDQIYLQGHGNMEYDDFWWRCDVRHYSVADEWGDHLYTATDISWTKYLIVRTTPKGVWLRGYLTREHFVRSKGKKQLALPTKELAIADAIARKERHVWGCQARLDRAKNDLVILLRTQTYLNK